MLKLTAQIMLMLSLTSVALAERNEVVNVYKWPSGNGATIENQTTKKTTDVYVWPRQEKPKEDVYIPPLDTSVLVKEKGLIEDAVDSVYGGRDWDSYNHDDY